MARDTREGDERGGGRGNGGGGLLGRKPRGDRRKARRGRAERKMLHSRPE